MALIAENRSSLSNCESKLQDSLSLNTEIGKPNQEVFASALLEIAEKDKDIVVVTSDSRGSAKLLNFAERLPEQLVEVGVAEQNLVGMAAGLASCGKKVFAVSPASFLTTRALEQIKNDVCYSDQPVTLVGVSAGVSYGALGSTHHSLHDIAVLRAINNIDIVLPADNFETQQVVRASVDHGKPLYIRFGKRPAPHVNREQTTFVIGQATILRDGRDVAFFATGETVYPSLAAADMLLAKGVTARVISMHTIAPLDSATILQAATDCRAIITVEEHMIQGGLGEAVAGHLLQFGMARPFRIVGILNEYTVTGSQIDIFNHYGISGSALAALAFRLLG
ncbi:transketolase family protein [candidate division KSB1 bacterium]|nr:transketolase family protein [candidate division KSB1 bacterium]